MVNALCPFPFRATLKFGAVSGSPSREGYTIPGSDAVTTSPDCQFKLTKSMRDILTCSAMGIYTIANWLKSKLTKFYVFQDLEIQPYILSKNYIKDSIMKKEKQGQFIPTNKFGGFLAWRSVKFIRISWWSI